MTYKLRIHNVLGIRSATIPLEEGEVTEVIGPNASGKTSVALSAQAVLAHRNNPLGFSAAEAKRYYPHDGAEDTKVDLEGPGGEVVWWPASGKVTAPIGDPPSCPEAVGLVDFMAKRSAKERAEAIQGALLPPPEEVATAAAEQLRDYLPEEDVRGIVDMLNERGWDAAQAVYGDRAKQAKATWRTVTGETWGSKKGADWRPDAWESVWDNLTPQMAEEAVVTAREGLAALHRVQAVTEAEAEAAERAADDLAILAEEMEHPPSRARALREEISDVGLDAANRRLSTLREEHWKAAETFKRQRREAETAALACPHCGDSVAYDPSGPKLVPYDVAEVEGRLAEVQAEMNRRAEAMNEAERKIVGLRQEIAPLKEALREAERATTRQAAEEARLRKVASRTGVVETAERRAMLAEAEQAVEDAQTVVRHVKAHADAERLHRTILAYVEVASALGPQGIRAKMLGARLATLNRGLGTLAGATGWDRVAVAADGAVTVGERPAVLCSESERWRAQACLQLTIAAMTGSKVVVLDRGDILDVSNREALGRALAKGARGKARLSILLCSTESETVRTTQVAEAPWRQIALSGGELAA